MMGVAVFLPTLLLTFTTFLKSHEKRAREKSSIGVKRNDVFAVASQCNETLVQLTPQPPAPMTRVMIATMITDDFENYARGACNLIRSVKDHGGLHELGNSYVFNFTVLCMEERMPSLEILNKISSCGWNTMSVKRIPPNDEGATYPRFRDQFTKLILWKMDLFDRILYFDSDCLVIGSISGLFRKDVKSRQLFVTRDISAGKWLETFNMGVFMIKPDAAEFERLMLLKQTTKVDAIMAEQGFLNEVYKGMWTEIGFEHNANLAAWTQDRSHWNKATIHVIHYTMVKPWSCSSEPDYAPVCAIWLDYERTMCPVTIVTSYFRAAQLSKHSEEEYSLWRNNFFSLDACMVVYTELPETEVYGARSRQNTMLVRTTLDEAVKNYLPWEASARGFWQLQHLKDAEMNVHKGFLLYQIWGLKTALLKEAVVQNPFSSNSFFWFDIGMLRDNKFNSFSPRALSHNEKNQFFLAEAMIQSQANPDENWLSGSAFGGSPEKCLQFDESYRSILLGMLKEGKFVGKDQSIFNRICMQKNGLCTIIKPDASVYDVWFGMAPFLLMKQN